MIGKNRKVTRDDDTRTEGNILVVGTCQEPIVPLYPPYLVLAQALESRDESKSMN